MIRDRFVQTRSAVIELAQVQSLIDSDGDDWRPAGVHAPGTSDPTAARAIRNVDVWGEQLELLRKREEELLDYIGMTLMIIEAVRDCFGGEYADILDARYIDCKRWDEIEIDGKPVPRTTGNMKINIVCDWIDSVGLTAILDGDCDKMHNI